MHGAELREAALFFLFLKETAECVVTTNYGTFFFIEPSLLCQKELV
jgi:hypothetical protein